MRTDDQGLKKGRLSNIYIYPSISALKRAVGAKAATVWFAGSEKLFFIWLPFCCSIPFL